MGISNGNLHGAKVNLHGRLDPHILIQREVRVAPRDPTG
jgi:hypothetical protein